jgi:predicted nucleic acid-binding protein
MRYLLDSGILLRVVNRADALNPQVRAAVGELRRQQHGFCTGLQNLAEFWNVCARPGAARGGHGLSIEATAPPQRLLERGGEVLTDTPATYTEWRRLVVAHGVMGVQVHDARVVALMLTHGVTHLLTLNKQDFLRYSGMTVVTPADVQPNFAPPPPPPASPPSTSP